MTDPTVARMQALIWQGPRKMTSQEVPAPRPGPSEALVQVEAVGICGSELSGYLGHNSLRKPPLIMGHEFAGTVEAVGDSAVGVRPGDRVVVNPLLNCGSCRACLGGRANLCPSRALIGAHRPGAFAEYVVVPAGACVRVPAEVATPVAAMAEPLACAVRALKLAGIGLGDKAVVIGAGPIGLLCALLAKRSGAYVQVRDTNPGRLETARAWGIEDARNPRDSARPKISGEEGDPQAVIDAVGLETTRKSAIEAVGRGGTVVFVGLHEASTSFDGNELVRNEVTVRGSFAYTPDDFAVSCSLLADGLLPDPDSWMSLRPLEAGPDSFDELVGNSPAAFKIVLQPRVQTKRGSGHAKDPLG